MVCNFCPVTRTGYRIGVPKAGTYAPVLSSDDAKYGGTGTELAPVKAKKEEMHGLPYSVELTLPPMSTVFYERKSAGHAKGGDDAGIPEAGKAGAGQTADAVKAKRGGGAKAQAAAPKAARKPAAGKAGAAGSAKPKAARRPSAKKAAAAEPAKPKTTRKPRAKKTEQ